MFSYMHKTCLYKHHIICTHSPCPAGLNLYFAADAEFSVEGATAIHLSGYLLPSELGLRRAARGALLEHVRCVSPGLVQGCIDYSAFYPKLPSTEYLFFNNACIQGGCPSRTSHKGPL